VVPVELNGEGTEAPAPLLPDARFVEWDAVVALCLLVWLTWAAVRAFRSRSTHGARSRPTSGTIAALILLVSLILMPL
jgi:hypothetical protein